MKIFEELKQYAQEGLNKLRELIILLKEIKALLKEIKVLLEDIRDYGVGSS